VLLLRLVLKTGGQEKIFKKISKAGSVLQPLCVSPSSHNRLGPKVVRAKQLPTDLLIMTATLSYTLVLALIYLGRKAWSLKTQL